MSRLLWLAYRLRTHLLGEWPLDRWPPFLAFAASAFILVRWWWRGKPLLPARHWAVLAVLLLAGTAALFVASWAAGRMYVVFEPDGEAVQPGARALDPEDKVLTYVTGRLEVAGKAHLFAGLLAYWRTFATREHTVMAIAHTTRFLVLGRTSPEDAGMWYLFVRPAAIESVSAGMLCFGSGPRPALRVVHRADRDALAGATRRDRSRPQQETFYLAFDDRSARDCVWADLVADGV